MQPEQEKYAPANIKRGSHRFLKLFRFYNFWAAFSGNLQFFLKNQNIIQIMKIFILESTTFLF